MPRRLLQRLVRRYHLRLGVIAAPADDQLALAVEELEVRQAVLLALADREQHVPLAVADAEAGVVARDQQPRGAVLGPGGQRDPLGPVAIQQDDCTLLLAPNDPPRLARRVHYRHLFGRDGLA